MIDLHIHSTASDGELSPEELVDLAIKKKIPVIAITDHEVVWGSKKAIEYARDKGVEVVSGIEIGVNSEKLEAYDIHVVGLFLDLDNERLLELSDRLMKARGIQKKAIISRLNELGYDITFEELEREVDGINYGRPHIARILMRKYDEFSSVRDVFDRLLGSSGKANVWQWKAGMKETIDIIHDAGGVAILAHPMFYGSDRFDCNRDKVIDRFVECGGDGIEVNYFYREEGDEMINVARGIAENRKLCASGGGDFHLKDGSFEIGDYGLSLEEFRRLRECWESRNGV